jgi:hypothetical protein
VSPKIFQPSVAAGSAAKSSLNVTASADDKASSGQTNIKHLQRRFMRLNPDTDNAGSYSRNKSRAANDIES